MSNNKPFDMRDMNNLRLRSICLAVIKQTHISSSSPSTTHHHHYHHESQGHWVREQQICAPRHSLLCVCAALVDPRTKLTYLPSSGGVRTHKEKARAQDNQAARHAHSSEQQPPTVEERREQQQKRRDETREEKGERYLSRRLNRSTESEQTTGTHCHAIPGSRGPLLS